MQQQSNFGFGSSSTQKPLSQDLRDDIEMTPAPVFTFGQPSSKPAEFTFAPPNPKSAQSSTATSTSSSWTPSLFGSSTSASSAPSASSTPQFAGFPFPSVPTSTSSTPSVISTPTTTSSTASEGAVQSVGKSTELRQKSGTDGKIKKRDKPAYFSGAVIVAARGSNQCSRKLKNRLTEMSDRLIAMTNEFPVMRKLQKMPCQKDLPLSSLLLQVQDLLTEYGSYYRSLSTARFEYAELKAVLKQHREVPKVSKAYSISEYSTPSLYQEAVRKELKKAQRRTLPVKDTGVTEDEVREDYDEKHGLFDNIAEEEISEDEPLSEFEEDE